MKILRLNIFVGTLLSLLCLAGPSRAEANAGVGAGGGSNEEAQDFAAQGWDILSWNTAHLRGDLYLRPRGEREN